jgi:hypothetical protein
LILLPFLIFDFIYCNVFVTVLVLSRFLIVINFDLAEEYHLFSNIKNSA